MTPKDQCPRELPMHPHGWTMQQTIHLNFGGGTEAGKQCVLIVGSCAEPEDVSGVAPSSNDQQKGGA